MRNRTESIDTILHPGSGFFAGLTHRAGSWLGAVLTWQQRAQERHAMASMDEHALKDIGLSKVDVLAEATKPFWRD